MVEIGEEQMEKARHRLLKSIDLVSELAGIAFHGLATSGDGEEGCEDLARMLEDDLNVPWNVEQLRTGSFRGILRLAGQAWGELNGCANDLCQGTKKPEKKLRPI
jgi:hypothetical protein